MAAACDRLATVTAASGKLSAQNDSEKGSIASRGTCTATISTKRYATFSSTRAKASTSPVSVTQDR